MKKVINKKNIPYLLMIISFVILIIRARYSFCWSDESLYLSTTSRFYRGDRIFVDEWFPTQLSSLLLLPLYSVYVAVTGGTDGIILAFRLLLVILELFSAIITYRIISKHHNVALGTALSMLTMWYCHLNIANLSYYTMSVHFFALTMLLLYDFYMVSSQIELSDNASEASHAGKDAPIKLIFAGFLFALCVLCLPTMCVAYFLVIFLLFCLTILAGLCKKSENILAVKIAGLSKRSDFLYVFKYTLLGIVVPAIIFAIYMLLHVSIPDFIGSLTYVLSDDEHELSKLYPLKKMYLAINESYGRTAKAGYLFIALTIAIYAFYIVFRNSKNKRLSELSCNLFRQVKPLVFTLDFILFALYLIKSFGHTGYIFTAILLFSLPLFLMTDRKNWTLFLLTYVSGLLFALVFSYSSNGMLYVLSMGHFISSLGGIIIIKDFADEMSDTRVISYLVSVIIIVCCLQTSILRITNVYRDDKLTALTEVTPYGPAKGLITSASHLLLYEDVYEDITTYCMSDSGYESKNLLISKLLPYGYLISDLQLSAPTAWRNPMGSLRLKEYYETHENKYPDVILVLDEQYGSYESCGDVEADPSPNENDVDGYIYDYIADRNMTKIQVNCGTIYIKK